ncbi:MAG: MMPL family transporter, partial [Gammaproteobacteria bacterium]
MSIEPLPDSERRLGAFLANWTRRVTHKPLLTLLVVAFAAAIAGYHAIGHLRVNTSTADMISDRLEWRQQYIEYRNTFPQFVSNVLVVLDGDIPEYVEDAQRRLADTLSSRADLFESVHIPGGGTFFETNALLYLEYDELQEVADRLARIQPLLGRLQNDPSLATLFDTLAQANESDATGIEAAAVYDRIASVLNGQRQGKTSRISWQSLLLDDEQAASPRVITVKPKPDFSRLLPMTGALESIRDIATELGIEPSVRVRLTGPVAMEHEELLSVSAGAARAGLLSLLAVTVILFVALRSARLVLACVLTLITGLAITAGFAALAVGRLNLISIAFAVLYVGLGIDFAIHYTLRYRELRHGGQENTVALETAASDVGASLVFSAITTSIGFYAFIPTDFSGVAELGLIGGTGMLIGLVVTLTLLPTLLTLMPLREDAPVSSDRNAPLRKAGLYLGQHRGTVLTLSAIAAVSGLWLIPHAQFDHNPLHLREANAESVLAFTELLAETGTTPLTLSVLRPDPTTAVQTASELRELELVSDTRTLNDFVPMDQSDKLAIVDEIGWLLGPDLGASTTPVSRPGDDLEAIQKLRATLDLDDPSQRRLAAAIEDWREWLISTPSKDAALGDLTISVLGTLPANLERLDRLLGAAPITVERLPEDITALWIAPDGRYRVEIVPLENLDDNLSARRFVESVRATADDAIGMPVVQVGAGDAVVSAFRFAFISAFTIITVLLWILMRNIGDVFRVLVPLMLAALLTGATAVLLDIRFNFANIIALPLLLGVGVDNGIHMVHRLRAAPPADGNVLGTSTARAILFSTITTIASFGSLALSQHPGTASMGE